MSMSASTLATALGNMTLYGSESAAISAWAGALCEYLVEAATVTMSVPIIAATVNGAGKTAIEDAMVWTEGEGEEEHDVGLSTEGAQAIADGLAAFWAAVAVAPSAYFTGAITPCAPPAGVAALESALDTVFAANVAAKKSKEDSLSDIADAIHLACTATPATITFAGPTGDTIL